MTTKTMRDSQDTCTPTVLERGLPIKSFSVAAQSS